MSLADWELERVRKNLSGAGKKVAFRVDASSEMGTGHLMRCLTLADALSEHGAHCRFISRHLPDYLRNLLILKGYESIVFEGWTRSSDIDSLAHSRWLGVGQDQDATDSLAALSDQNWDCLVVDNYALGHRWESAIRPVTAKVFAIDDLADRVHDADVLLDQNFYVDMSTRYSDKLPRHCEVLLGPDFALLRKEFEQIRGTAHLRAGSIGKILVFWGGVDPDNYTGLTIEALKSTQLRNAMVDVVIGAQHPHRSVLQSLCAERGFSFHVQTDRMGELMLAADLAIGAAGSTSWERCSVGLPCILGAIAQNQIQAARDLASLNIVKYLGAGAEITACRLQEEIAQSCVEGWLEEASRKAFNLVDSFGVKRVLKVMEVL